MRAIVPRGKDVETKKRYGDLLHVLLIAAMAAIVLHRSAYSASNLEIVPDAVEYAVVADRLAHGQGLGIVVDGNVLPSRYAPWFSLLLMPGCALSGAGPGGAIYVVTLFAIAGIVLAFWVGRRVAGPWGGAGAALSVLALPAYRFWGRQIMTDVPSTALLIGAALVYSSVRNSPSNKVRLFALAGGIIALAALLRPLCGVAIVPFVVVAVDRRVTRARLRSLGALLGPLALVVAATSAFNTYTFGAVGRSGYQFWCPVPYDYPSLVFSLSYIPKNLAAFLDVGLGLPVIAAIGTGWLRFRNAACPVVRFLILGVAPITAFHLVYFFPGDRFHLPLAAGCALLAGSLVGGWLERFSGAVLGTALVALVGVLAWVAVRADDEPPERRIAVERIVRATPEEAWVISAIDPAYLQHFAGNGRRFVPISRRVEYASKLIARKRIDRPDPPPTFWDDYRVAGLLRGGAVEAVARVADESVDLMRAEMAHGRRIFLDTTCMDKSYGPAVATIAHAFEFAAIESTLYELRPRAAVGTVGDVDPSLLPLRWQHDNTCR